MKLRGVTQFSSGRRAEQDFTGGQSDYYTYDDIGQLTDVESDEPRGLEIRENEMRTYEYDPAGNLAWRGGVLKV